MLKKILLTTSAVAAALGFSSGAFADPPHWAPAHGWRAHHHQPPRAYYYYAPRPVYVVPAPRVVYAAPPYVATPYVPAPVYAPAPVYPAPGISIRFNLPL